MTKENPFDINNFGYAKREPHKKQLDVSVPTHDLKNDDGADNKINALSNASKDTVFNSFGESFEYEKDWGSLDPYIIIMICEDAKRTYQYFNRFVSYINNTKYKLVPVNNKESGIPFPHMIEKANAVVAEIGLDLENGDTLYLISDLDHYRDAILKEARSSEWNEKYQLIISNPCVEIWFYYHFEDMHPAINIKDKNENQISSLMKSHNHKVVQGGIDHRKLATPDYLNTAIKNSKKNFSMEDNNIIPALFSTQMHIVADKLKEAMV